MRAHPGGTQAAEPMSLHIDIPTGPEIEALLDARRPGCVSIYLPTSPLPQEAGAARIDLRNLADEAAGQLTAAGMAVTDLQEQVDDLLEDDAFWSTLAVSLAVFAEDGGMRTFRLPNRLTRMVEVSDRFHVKPLLRSVTFPQACFVLALAQGSVRLVEVAADVPAEAVRVADLPADVASAVGKASITDRTAVGRIQGSEGQKVRMRQYARAVDRALRPVLHGLGLPLVLAAAEPLRSIYRSVCTYPGLVEQDIPGNPEARTPAELAASAREVLDELYAERLAELRDLFEARTAQGRAATDLTDVARAATFGAVQTLMADIDAVVPGEVDTATGAVTLADGEDAHGYGVIDEVARRVLLTGGRVLALRRDDIPRGDAVAAILRHPV
jgi:hypothetical protein